MLERQIPSRIQGVDLAADSRTATIQVAHQLTAQVAAITPDICHTGRWECQNRTSGATSAIRLGMRRANAEIPSVTSALDLSH